SSRRTKARTLCPLASSISVTWRPMEPTAPAAPVTRIGLACDDCVVISTSAHSGGAANSAAPVHRLCWRVPCEEDRADGQRNAGEAVQDRQGRRDLKAVPRRKHEWRQRAFHNCHWS